MSKHATLGASSSNRWMNCAGSVRMSDGLPNQSTVYAVEGTAAHDLAARALMQSLPPSTWLGDHITVVVEENGTTVLEAIEVTDEMVEAVAVYTEYVTAQARAGVKLLIEQRFDLEALSPPEPMFGTADAVFWDEEALHLEVVDLKYGAGVYVDPTENSQMMYYALGAVIALRVVPETIRLTVVQPRIGEEAIKHYDLEWPELVEFKQELFARAEATQAPDAPLNAGGWCRFCPAAPTCPAQYERTKAITQSEFAVGMEPPRPEMLTDEELNTVLAASHDITAWLRVVKEYVRQRLAAGQKVPGWKLVEGRASRTWIDEEKAREFMEAHGISPERSKLRSVAQAEAALKEVSTALPDELVSLKRGTMLVPDTDRRVALPPSAQTDFDVETDS